MTRNGKTSLSFVGVPSTVSEKMLCSIIYDDFRISWEIWKKVQFFETRSRIILLALTWRDKIDIFILLFSCLETSSRLHIVILMFRDENEKHTLNVSRSSEKNVSQFSRDLARTRILADLWLRHPKTTPRHLQGSQDVNRQQHDPTDTFKHTQTAPDSVRGCLGVSVCVCWLLFPFVDFLNSLEMSGGVWGMFRRCFYGYLSGIHGNL